MRPVTIAVVISLFLSGCVHAKPETPLNETSGNSGDSRTATGSGYSFNDPQKSAHYESNSPAHASILPAPPINVVVDVNFDLAKPSSISVSSKGIEYGLGDTTIDGNKLSMRRVVNQDAPDGLYNVVYRACWPDGSCHDGSFQFAIDRSLSDDYQDRRSNREVTIDLQNVSFLPRSVRIRTGTMLVWNNTDSVDHYINTDSHPSHTYYPAQNSKLLKPSDSYTLTFDQPGYYPYHCSAHASTMTGSILVESP